MTETPFKVVKRVVIDNQAYRGHRYRLERAAWEYPAWEKLTPESGLEELRVVLDMLEFEGAITDKVREQIQIGEKTGVEFEIHEGTASDYRVRKVVIQPRGERDDLRL